MSTSPSRRLLTAALAAADRGWPVFPLVPYGKRPAINAWPQRATCDPDQLAVWWQRAPYNVGIACGPASLLVVDLDRPAEEDAPDGRAVFAALARVAGARPEPTYRILTPSGGEHRYYTVTPGPAARSTVGLLGSHVDTRGAGGYVAGAGSVRCGRTGSRWYHIADLSAPAPIPPWLSSLLTPPRPAAPTAPFRLPQQYASAAAAGECDLVRRAHPGTRNATLFRAALRLGSLAGAGMLDASVATTRLHDAAAVHFGRDGFTATEAGRAIASGLRYGRAHPRQVQHR